MLKLIRNTFGSIRLIVREGSKISWNYIENLYHLQKSEGLYLGNKVIEKGTYSMAKTKNEGKLSCTSD